MTRVKICGITSLQDAALAVRLGADMIGFNFYQKSPRFIEPQAAADIAKSVSDDVVKVGVFVNMEIYRISELVSLIGLDAVQIHGDEDDAFLDELKSETDAKIIKAYRIIDKDGKAPPITNASDYVLLDSFSAGYGGSGNAFDWSLTSAFRDVRDRLFLAGGLTPENVAYAVRQVRPFAVDVASGVESSNGKKDPKKLEEFIAAAKQG
jgi:phosphoribosylanthranilate isomerase